MIVENNKCSGCSACYSVCPKNAIKMVEDSEGFLYPQLNEDLCINCKLCEKVCSSLNKTKCELEKTYAAISTNEEAKLRSSSGGIFYELATKVLSEGGYVCGAAFDDNNQVHHIIVNDCKDLDKLMRSKYVQSRIENVMRDIKTLLNDGKKVLFVGTACQVNGLKLFLRKDYDNLLTCDIICHGVPSPKVWQYYLNYASSVLETKKLEDINFRDKKYGWLNFSMSMKGNNFNVVESHKTDIFFKSFLKDYCLRPSCYECECRGSNRVADITLADFWGFNNFDLKLKHNDKGLSLLVLHTTRAIELLNSIETIEIEEVSKESLKYNPSYYKSVAKPGKRDEYMTNVNSDNFKEITLKYTYIKLSFVKRCIRKLKRIIKNILNRL